MPLDIISPALAINFGGATYFVDVNNAPYQSWTISTAPVGHWLQNTNQTNVSNIPTQVMGMTMCVFELK
ncbi:MAG: hypothetical protein K2L95_00375 [Alphaproteobacteria bacterium]|nr:hypothetical protein [Alphaproteobacteria bacterium]